MKKVAVVTGGAGFIGGHLCEALLKRGYHVRVLDNFVVGKRANVPRGARLVKGDVRNPAALKKIVKGSTVIFHLAALPRVQYSIEHPEETHAVNVTGTVNVLGAARAAGARVILASSAAVYGDIEKMPLSEDMQALPTSPYGVHKHIGEQYLKLFAELYGLKTVSLRFFNVYGPRLDPHGPYALLVGRFLMLRKNNKPLTIIGKGTNTRDFIHVHDIVRGLILAAESVRVGKGEVINLGTGIETSVNQIASLIGGERTHLPPRIEPRASRADIKRAKKLLRWAPQISFKQGIAELKKEWGL